MPRSSPRQKTPSAKRRTRSARPEPHPFTCSQRRIESLAALAQCFLDKAVADHESPDERMATIALRALGQILDEQKEAKKDGDPTLQEFIEALAPELAERVLAAVEGEADELL